MRPHPPTRLFATAPDGRPVHIVTLERAGTTAHVMTWGASLQNFEVAGIPHPLVLGSPQFAPYLTRMRHYGAIAGRVANRIAGGRAMIDGRAFLLERNEADRTTLHGGSDGAGRTNWTLDGASPTSCRLTLRLPDGQGGFPGNLDLVATYRLDEVGALVIELEGVTDAPTLCNLAHHSYWNLAGSGDIASHDLTVSADTYLPVDAAKIPLGPAAPVAGTRFDFRTPRPVCRESDAALDHNFCLRQAGIAMHPACRLASPIGIALDVTTTEPGLQVYDGANVASAPAVGHTGTPYGPRAGIALEPQRWPDAPNHAGYPSVLLHPGEIYRQASRFHVRRLPAFRPAAVPQP